ncbi:MAG: NAD(P)H-dependent oxidoreductase subunit E, partial [Dehalococcoidia bacterium]|nr:NAD(P)H-dependent oxidoreductase subunit E [Dehalococcoidia bacterium]
MSIDNSVPGNPAPYLHVLHEAHARYGSLSRQTLTHLVAELGRPVADLFQVATFYHYFTVGEDKALQRGVCRGPACSLPGSASTASEDLPSISCPGLCDQPVPEYDAGRFSSNAGGAGVFSLPASVDTKEALFRHVRTPGIDRLEVYRGLGGYRQLISLVEGDSADSALDTLRESGLTGCGGAAFPLPSKWRAVRESVGKPRYLICNADEGEPGTFKDRPLLHLVPHLVLEAMAIGGYVTGAEIGIIYLRYEYPEAVHVLTKAITEAEEAGLLGSNILGTGFDFSVHLQRGAGSY